MTGCTIESIRSVSASIGPPPSRVRHRRSLTITAGAPPTRCSSGRKLRPTSGRTPITSKNSRETLAPAVIVASTPIDTGSRPPDISAIAAKLRVPDFQSSKFGSETVLVRSPVPFI